MPAKPPKHSAAAPTVQEQTAETSHAASGSVRSAKSPAACGHAAGATLKFMPAGKTLLAMNLGRHTPHHRVVFPAIVLLLAGAFAGPFCRAQEEAGTLSAPAVWIFAGLPGDPEREQRYLATVETMAQALTGVCALPEGRVRILFGSGKPSRYHPCDRKNLFRELERVRETAAKHEPVWLFFLGHANSTKTAVFLNLDGRDLDAGELAERLGRLDRDCPTALFFTTAASGHFIGPMRQRNRAVAAAQPADQPDNEAEMPHILAGVLAEAHGADADRDGILSMPELLREVRRQTDAWYAERELVPTERVILDGNGDGNAQPLPSVEEESAAAGMGLPLRQTDDTRTEKMGENHE